KARPRLETAIGLGFEVEIGQTRQPVEHRLHNRDSRALAVDALWHLELVALDQHHVPCALLVAGLTPDKQLLALDRVDQDTEPTAILANDADRNRACLCAKAEVDDRDNRRLSRLRGATNDIDHPGLEIDDARFALFAGPKDQFSQLEVHQ